MTPDTLVNGRPHQTTEHHSLKSKAYRTFICACGIFFLALAFAIFRIAEFWLATFTAGILVGAPGLDALISALRSQKPLLFRMGMLP